MSPHDTRDAHAGVLRSDVAVVMIAGIGGRAAAVPGLVARSFPFGELEREITQLGCDHGSH